MDSHLGLYVAVGGRACSWCNLRHSTQSPWAFALPSFIMDVVADGGLSIDIIGPVGVVVLLKLLSLSFHDQGSS